MQTFLPYSDFYKTAEVLDYKRLGKQRVEGFQIINTLGKRSTGITTGAWVNHPAVLMWTNHEISLINYCIAITEEWVKRGYNDTMLERFKTYKDVYLQMGYNERDPLWLGDSKLHDSHKSNLVRKDADYYYPIFEISSDIPYYWPV